MIVIIDIDGTLADVEHRRHFVAVEKDQTPDWRSFNESMIVDTPILPMVTATNALFLHGNSVFLATGRDETYRQHTVEWLTANKVNYDILFMRPAKDYREDSEIKREILTHIRANYGEPAMVFDDRKSVIDMWMSEGIFVADVSQGKGNF